MRSYPCPHHINYSPPHDTNIAGQTVVVDYSSRKPQRVVLYGLHFLYRYENGQMVQDELVIPSEEIVLSGYVEYTATIGMATGFYVPVCTFTSRDKYIYLSSFTFYPISDAGAICLHAHRHAAPGVTSDGDSKYVTSLYYAYLLSLDPEALSQSPMVLGSKCMIPHNATFSVYAAAGCDPSDLVYDVNLNTNNKPRNYLIPRRFLLSTMMPLNVGVCLTGDSIDAVLRPIGTDYPVVYEDCRNASRIIYDVHQLSTNLVCNDCENTNKLSIDNVCIDINASVIACSPIQESLRTLAVIDVHRDYTGRYWYSTCNYGWLTDVVLARPCSNTDSYSPAVCSGNQVASGSCSYTNPGRCAYDTRDFARCFQSHTLINFFSYPFGVDYTTLNATYHIDYTPYQTNSTVDIILEPFLNITLSVSTVTVQACTVMQADTPPGWFIGSQSRIDVTVSPDRSVSIDVDSKSLHTYDCSAVGDIYISNVLIKGRGFANATVTRPPFNATSPVIAFATSPVNASSTSSSHRQTQTPSTVYLILGVLLVNCILGLLS